MVGVRNCHTLDLNLYHPMVFIYSHCNHVLEFQATSQPQITTVPRYNGLHWEKNLVSQRSRTFHFPLKWGTVDLCQSFSHSLLHGSGSYKLTVDAAEIGEGPLSISVSVRFACLIQVYTATVYVAIVTNGTTPVRWVVRLISQQRELRPHTAASVQRHIGSILYILYCT